MRIQVRHGGRKPEEMETDEVRGEGRRGHRASQAGGWQPVVRP